MQDIQGWLAELGLEKYAEAFAEAEIDFEILPSLDKEDLKDLGLPIGPRRKIMDAIQELGGMSVPLPRAASTHEIPSTINLASEPVSNPPASPSPSPSPSPSDGTVRRKLVEVGRAST